MPDEPDFAQVCAQIEDCLVPFLSLSTTERAIYYHLFRHSRAQGSPTLRVTRRSLARSAGLSPATVYTRLHALARKGCIRVLERSYRGHLLEVLLPSEIPACLEAGPPASSSRPEPSNCFRSPRLRAAILRREGHLCFYCLSHLGAGTAVLDHIIPLSAGGDNSLRNVVACCFDCNVRKGESPAEDFLRRLFRAGRLGARELELRLAALSLPVNNEVRK